MPPAVGGGRIAEGAHLPIAFVGRDPPAGQVRTRLGITEHGAHDVGLALAGHGGGHPAHADERVPAATHSAQADADLAVADRAEGSALPARNADGVAFLVGKPGVINHPHLGRVGKTGTQERRQGGDDGCVIPRGVGQAPLDGSWQDAADGFRDGCGMTALGA